jgi:threonine/homoserine/homoserine lactone efflux protein
MPKAMTYIGLGVAAMMIVAFGLDAAIGVPFRQASIVFDVGMIVCSLVLAYMSWSTLRELR